MSAVPRPQTDESAVQGPSSQPQSQPQPGSEAEGWALLESLRRRLDEQANQHRKTQTQVQQLADSIGALVTVQRNRSRWLNLNSFVAYVVFTILCGGAFYLLYQSRARDLVAERDRIAHERELAAQHSKQVTDQLAAREAADTKAWDAYQLLETGKRDDAAKKLAELQGAPLSKFERTVLDAKAKQADVLQVDATLKNVAAAFKSGKQADTIGPLEVALTLESVGPRAALMHYYLGVAYAKVGTLDKAVSHLQAAVEGDVDVEDARFQYASALDRAGEWGRAKVEYERFATAHPQSPHTTFATRRSWGLARLPEHAPKGAVTDPAAGAAPATAAPTAAPAAAPPTAPATTPRAPAPAPARGGAAAPTAPAPKTLDFNEPE